MSHPLNDTELDSLLAELHRDVLHQWSTDFAQRGHSRPERWSDRLMSDLDMTDTDGLNTTRFLQVTIADLLARVTAHLGAEGEFVAHEATGHLCRLLTGLQQSNLTLEQADVLTADLAEAEQHLRAMVNLDFAGSTCRRTHEALDELRASITYLDRHVRARLRRAGHDLAGR
ncbi:MULTISPECIES: hypothetical protein [Nocardiopsis]|uniref:RsbT co-antagonist protein RsbRD N-terminal domain-containing protein n=1 Tax=Nocardiopsis sinuspersici TaxID=501010 RepID=A0A1V3BVU9_9ACTN|nr:MULTISPECIES: hypothetical protein [Nocardiopsis]OOC52492.1 hypothetical protein NOSIN_00455 [Nocardiopsis sinuspersici]